jgi:hypothetical protein
MHAGAQAPGMTGHRTTHRRARTSRRKGGALRIRATAWRTPPDLRVLAETLIDLAAENTDNPSGTTGTSRDDPSVD